MDKTGKRCVMLTLKTSNLMDFDDLLYYLYRLLLDNQNIQNWFKENTFILVDECQDINKIQYEIIKLLARRSGNIFMVGDEDQCIYSFRGSDLNCIRDFKNEEKAEVYQIGLISIGILESKATFQCKMARKAKKEISC